MALNWKEIDRVLSELDMGGCMIRQIHSPDRKSIVLTLYKPDRRERDHPNVYVSLSNPHCRLHRLTRRLETPSRPYRFVAFLRAHIRGGRILAAEQIEDQRIVRLQIRKGDSLYTLWIRLWGGAANILLTDPDRRILDAFYRRPKRNEVSGGAFEPPESRKDGRKEMDVRSFDDALDGVSDGTGSQRAPRDYNRMVEEHFFALEEAEERQTLKRRLLKDVQSRESRILLNVEKLKGREEKHSDAERLKELGDLVTSSLHRIQPGDRWVEAEDFYNGGGTLEIELNPELSPAQNAERFYEMYRRAKRSRENHEEELRSLEQTLVALESRRRRIEETDDLTELRAMSGGSRSAARKSEEQIPGAVYDSGPFRVIVGRTSNDNDRLLRDFVTGNDYWFHTRDFPGAYVFVKPTGGKRFSKQGRTIPLEAMLDAANLAVFHSKGRGSGQADVYYTQVKYLRRVKGGKRGLVIPTHEKNLFIQLDPERIERLKKSRALG